MKEPDYYVSNGLSPIGAFKQGLISEDEYRGFLIGNIIKYTIRAGKKDNAVEDLNKARNYIDFYIELVKSEPTITIKTDVDEEKLLETIAEAKAIVDDLVERIAKDPEILKVEVVPDDDTILHELKDAIKKIEDIE